MCLYSRLIPNPRYKPNKKNNRQPPKLKYEALKYVPVSCGRCIECRRKKQREWIVRLQEELRQGSPPLFVTLTIDDTNLSNLRSKENEDPNETATRAVRLFLERIRKKTRKSIKHWFITELGEEKGRIHLHGFFWGPTVLLLSLWKYGFVYIGSYTNEQSIFYMTKYMLKENPYDKNFIGKVLCSAGIGKGYENRLDAKIAKFDGENTKEYYRLRNGAKMAIPTYYRNKIYNEEEREILWYQKVKKGDVYICGEKTKAGSEEYYNLLHYYRERAKELYGDNPQEWDEADMRKKRLKLEKQIEENILKLKNIQSQR